MLNLKEHLKSLVEAHAPSGHEAPIRKILREAWKPLVDSFEEDGLGSLMGIRRAVKPLETPRKIMLAAHMDEIGMTVREVRDGFIFVHSLAGIDARVMVAQPVVVQGKRQLPGIVASIPPHLTAPEDRKRYPRTDELIIDVGLPADEVAELVRVGDWVTPDVEMLELNGNRLAAKAFDDRACVAAVTACLDNLQSLIHTWDVYATATVQEERGLMGATTAAYHIQPDIAIALDVTFATQPGVDGDISRDMGGGPVLSFGPNFHPKLVEQIRKTAKQHEIKIQEDILPGNSGTDAWAIQVSREGVPTALLSIPIRNMHSPIETLDLSDIERTGRLLAHFITELNADFLQTIAWQQAPTASEA